MHSSASFNCFLSFLFDEKSSLSTPLHNFQRLGTLV